MKNDKIIFEQSPINWWHMVVRNAIDYYKMVKEHGRDNAGSRAAEHQLFITIEEEYEIGPATGR